MNTTDSATASQTYVSCQVLEYVMFLLYQVFLRSPSVYGPIHQHFFQFLEVN